MIQDGLKLTGYFDERQRSGRRFLADAMLDVCEQHEIKTSIALRGVGGFGLRHDLRTDRLLSLSEDPPMTVVAVGRAVDIQRILDPLRALSARALFTVERVAFVAFADSGVDPGPPGGVTESVKLTVYLGRRERIDHTLGYLALCELFYRHGFDGGAVLLGVDGILGGRRERARFFNTNTRVPAMVVAIATPDRVRRAVAELSRLPKPVLVTVERIRICKRDGRLLQVPLEASRAVKSAPHSEPDADEPITGGNSIGETTAGGWQKITVHTFEADRHHGEPIHRALIRSLRDEQFASGATALRAVWGFHGAHRPHGDRLFQLGRGVPVATTVIDKADNLPEVFAVIDSVTSRYGLVTIEALPILLPAGD